MRVEIDQSGKLEQLNTHTVISLANHTNASVYILSSEKIKLVKVLRKSIVPRKDLMPVLFGVVISILILKMPKLSGTILIDEEYTGKDALIKETIEKIIKKYKPRSNLNLVFGRVGKHSPAHKLCWKIHRSRDKKEASMLKSIDILKKWV